MVVAVIDRFLGLIVVEAIARAVFVVFSVTTSSDICVLELGIWVMVVLEVLARSPSFDCEVGCTVVVACPDVVLGSTEEVFETTVAGTLVV